MFPCCLFQVVQTRVSSVEWPNASPYVEAERAYVSADSIFATLLNVVVCVRYTGLSY